MKFANTHQMLSTFLNIGRAIYESQYGDGIGTDGKATLSAEIDNARKIHISITMEDLTEKAEMEKAENE